MPSRAPARDLSVYHERTRTRGVNPVVYWTVRGRAAAADAHLLPRAADRPGPRAAQGRRAARPEPPQLPRPVRDRHLRRGARPTSWPSRSSSTSAGRPGCSTRSAPSRCAAARPTRRQWRPPACWSSAARWCSSSPRARASARARSASPSAASAAWRFETGAPVVPIAVTGSENTRRGWKVRPAKVKIRLGRPLTFPRVESPSPRLASEVTARIWPCVELQWEWLGGLPPLRKAGDRRRRLDGHRARHPARARGHRGAAGLPHRGPPLSASRSERENERLPGVVLPDEVKVSTRR